MKINRLLEITILLMNKGTVTAKELADRFEVSTRTIYRDIDVLSSAGVPVFTNKGNGGGISLMENYSLNKALISEHESESLLLALKTLKAIKYPDIDNILVKMGAMFKNAASVEWVNVDFSPWGSNPNESNKFSDIKKAILERRVILFDYVNANGDKSNRSLEPMQLSFKGQAWYLTGYCRMRKEFRVFRISRIKNVVVTKESFERKTPEDFEKNEDNKDSKNSKNSNDTRAFVKLKLKFFPEILHRIYDDFDEEFISKNADGTCDVTVVFPEDEWVYGYIMSFGCYVKVLEPEHVRYIVADRMRKALGHYDI